MKIKRKNVLFVVGAIIGLAVIIFLYFNRINNNYRNQILVIQDSSSLSIAVKDQITDAYNKAYHHPSSENLGELGMVFHSTANYIQAGECYELAAERSRSGWKWNYYLGYLNMELGISNKVVDNFTQVITINPDIRISWYYLGEAYRNLGKNDLAEKAFLRIRDLNDIPVSNNTTRSDHFPLSAYAMFELSKIYIDGGRTKQAEEMLIKLTEQNELFGQAYRLLGNIYAANGDNEQAEKFNIRANDLILYSPPVDTLIDKISLLSRSELYLLKKIDEATNNSYSDWGLRLVEHGLKYMPDNKYLVSKAIELYLWKDMLPEAAGLADRHINFFSNSYNELGKIGTLFFQKGMYDEAKEYLTKAWELKSENTDIIKNLAICYQKTGESQKALEILTEAADANKENPDLLAGIANALILLENKGKAIEYLKILERRFPENPKVQKLAGKLAEENGNNSKAIKLYETSFKGDSKDVETINSLGDLLMHEKMWKKYMNFYKEVLNFSPNNPEYLEKMSTFYLGCPDKSFRNLDEGIEYSKRAFINISSPPDIMLTAGKNLAVAYATKRDRENALITIKKTIAIGERTNAPETKKQELQQLYQVIQKM